MVKQLLILLSLCAVVAMGSSAITLSGAPIIPIGDNSEDYDVGYQLGLGFEQKFGDYFGIQLEAAYGYIYAEKKDYVRLYIDNDMYIGTILPKLYLPLNSSFSLVAAAGLMVAHVETNVDIYVLPFYYDNISTSDQVVSLITGGGFSTQLSDALGLDFLVLYNPINGQNLSGMSQTQNVDIADNSVDIATINIKGVFKYLF